MFLFSFLLSHLIFSCIFWLRILICTNFPSENYRDESKVLQNFGSAWGIIRQIWTILSRSWRRWTTLDCEMLRFLCATCQICFYASKYNFKMNGFRPTWPRMIIKVLIAWPSGNHSVINCAFIFCPKMFLFASMVLWLSLNL